MLGLVDIVVVCVGEWCVCVGVGVCVSDEQIWKREVKSSYTRKAIDIVPVQCLAKTLSIGIVQNFHCRDIVQFLNILDNVSKALLTVARTGYDEYMELLEEHEAM